MKGYENAVFNYANKREITREEFEAKKYELSEEDFARNYLEASGNRYYYIETPSDQILISMLNDNLQDMKNAMGALYEKVNLLSWIVVIEFVIGLLSAVVAIFIL